MRCRFMVPLFLAASLAACASPIAESTAPLPTRPAAVPMLTMITPRALHADAALRDGRVLLCGGASDANIGGVLASAEIYDPVAGTFARTSDMRTARQAPTATVLPNGQVLIAGGSSNVGYRSQLASAEIYDPQTGRFSATGSMTTPREGHSATLLRNGRVLIAGGSANGLTTTASAEIYTPQNGRFTEISPMGVPREAHTATLLKNGRVVIAGGGRGKMPGGYIAYDTAEIFDPASNTFGTLRAHMVTDRVGLAASLLNDGRVLLAGGKSGKMGLSRFAGSLFWLTPLDTAEVFDPETNSFHKVGKMQRTHYLGVATKLNDGKVLITGGWNQRGPAIAGEATAELFDPARDIFSGGGQLNVPRLEQTSTTLPSGMALVAGGINGDSNVTATVEFYAPKHGTFVITPASLRANATE